MSTVLSMCFFTFPGMQRVMSPSMNTSQPRKHRVKKDEHINIRVYCIKIECPSNF